MTDNTRFILVRRPEGAPVAADFALVAGETPALAEGEVLVRNRFASLDPAMRGWMDDRPSYLPPMRLGDAVRAATIGTVEHSRDPARPVGSWVQGLGGIEQYTLHRGAAVRPIDPDALPSVTNHLSLSSAGLAAYCALLEVGRPQAGETVLVSGAAGAVGSIVGQIARMKGCRTIGIAGGPEKCGRLLRDYGYDAAIDYRGRQPDALADAIRQAAPDGIDLHFENVGGAVLDAALLALRPRGRVVLCGLIGQYNGQPAPVANLWQLIVQGARIEGFIMTQFAHRVGEVLPQLVAWVRDGALRIDEHVEDGIENALPAFLRLFDGSNRGKMILRLAG